MPDNIQPDTLLLLSAALVIILLLTVLLILLFRLQHTTPDQKPDKKPDENTNKNTDEKPNTNTKPDPNIANFLLLNQQIQSVNDNVNRLQQLFRNIKLRGSWGEIQLGAILSEMLIPAQYEANVAIDPLSNERVEYALKLPLPDNTYLWLPIDSKCPIEDFERLQAAIEQNDSAATQSAARALRRRILSESADIAAKYIRPPYGTDFALLFIPIESIYQYTLTDTELIQSMERQYRVIPTGPSTLSAVLNLLQLSHRSMALATSERELWQTLDTAKSEFAAFDDSIAKTRKKAEELTNNLDNMSRRLRIIERRLNQLENSTDSQKPLD